MKFGVYLTGAFGQSQQLYLVRNEAKRGRASQEKVQEQIRSDTQKIIQEQLKSGCSFITNPAFDSYYLFQSLTRIPGISAGPQENWFNNNVFYRRPKINGPVRATPGFSLKDVHLELFPIEKTLAILPSPYTLLTLSDVSGYAHKQAAILDLAMLLRREAEHLVSSGITRIQYDEPALVVKRSLDSLTNEDIILLQKAFEICGPIDGATTIVHTYFGDAAPVLSSLLDLPVNGIGIDCTETALEDILTFSWKEKELVLGLLDARSPALEAVSVILEQVERTLRHEPKALWISPNTGTEYLGWTYGLKKLAILHEVSQYYENYEKAFSHV